MVRLVLRAVAIGAVLLTLGGAKAWAGMDEGKAAYERGDYATVMREWQPLAEQSTPDLLAQGEMRTSGGRHC